jgi:predicted metalloendopeptidase
MVNNDPHAPNSVRVNGAVRNNREFKAAFGCGGESVAKVGAEGVCSLY